MGHALTLELPMGLRPGALRYEYARRSEGLSATQALMETIGHMSSSGTDRQRDDEYLEVILRAALLLYHHGVNEDMEQPTFGQSIHTASVWFFG